MSNQARFREPDIHDVEEALARMRDTAGELNASCCPIRNVIANLGSKWVFLVVILLAEKPFRFNQLRRSLPDISQRVLTASLRSLTRDGIVTRTVYPTRPPSVEYALTPAGYAFLEAFAPVVLWAQEHHDSIVASRECYDAEVLKQDESGAMP